MITMSYSINIERLTTKAASTMPGILTSDTTPKKKEQVPTKLDTIHLKAIDFPNPSTPTRYLFKTIITVAIGPQHKTFYLHREALLSVSPFFTAAFNPKYAFRESLTAALSLPEANPLDFEYFIQWLYTRTLSHEALSGPHPAYFKLIKLWKLADCLGVTALKNSIVDEIAWRAEETNSVPTPDDTVAIYGGEEQMGALRELVLDLFVWKKTETLVREHPDPWDQRFLRELFGRMKSNRGQRPPWKEERCSSYHEHDLWSPLCEGMEVVKEE